MENASPLELFWTATALAGLVAALWSGGVSTVRGVLGRRRGQNGPTTLLFISNVLTAFIFVMICGLFALSGLIAIATPPPVTPQNIEASNTISMIFTVCNVAIAGYLLVKIYLNSKIDQAVLREDRLVRSTRLAAEAATALALAIADAATDAALAKAEMDIAEARRVGEEIGASEAN